MATDRAADVKKYAPIKEVGATMKDGTRNSRIAAYYLLAEKFGKLGMLR